MKRTLIISIIFLSLILFTIGVYAAGGGGGGGGSSRPECTLDFECKGKIECKQPANPVCKAVSVCAREKCTCATLCQKDNRISDTEENNEESEFRKNRTARCEDAGDLRARIKCRLEKRGVDLNVTEESCRVLKNPANCQSLYAKVASCYKMSGKVKDNCFKRIAGFTKNKIKEEGASNKESLRNYMVFVLYNLQEKVEYALEEGRVDSEKASSVISSIIELKQAILLNKTKEEIKPLLVSLKTEMKEINYNE